MERQPQQTRPTDAVLGSSTAGPGPAAGSRPPVAPAVLLLGDPTARISCHIGLDVLEDILGHGRTEPHREVGGILLGTLGADGRGPTAWVEDMVPARLAAASATHVTFTHETWVQIHHDIESRDDHLQIVGWYHTHPGFGPFYSAQDHFIHRNFFTDKRHIGIVLDPIRVSLSVFGWVEGDVRRLRACAVYAAQDQAADLEAFAQGAVYV